MKYGRAVVERTLEDLGVKYVETGSSWAEALCPLHDDDNPSFTVHLDEGGWRCYAGCGSSGDLAALVAAITNESIPDARRRLLRGLATDDSIIDRLSEPPHGITISTLGAQDPPEYERGRVPRYFFRRGFTKETAVDWDVGWDSRLEALVVPVYQDGKLVGLVRRKLNGSPKYVNSAGLVKSDVLFGLDHIPFGATEVTIVEGPLDAMWLYQHGYPAVSTLGAGLSATQADVIKRRFWRVVLAYDADRAGAAATQRALAALRSLDVRVLTLPPGKKDVQECDAEELALLYLSV